MKSRQCIDDEQERGVFFSDEQELAKNAMENYRLLPKQGMARKCLL